MNSEDITKNILYTLVFNESNSEKELIFQSEFKKDKLHKIWPKSVKTKDCYESFFDEITRYFKNKKDEDFI